MQISISRIYLAWLILVLFLSGCATTTPKPTAAPQYSPSVMHKQHVGNIAQIQQFSLKGRIGVISKPKNFSARMAWQHQPEQDNIDIYSPLGGKVANIVKTPDQVTLTDSKQKSRYAQDVETLTEDTLGFRLPLSGLEHWALGKPSDKSIVNAITWNESGRTTSLEQDGWHIQYDRYTEFEGHFLPKKITLKNNTITLKLIVDKWSEL